MRQVTDEDQKPRGHLVFLATNQENFRPSPQVETRRQAERAVRDSVLVGVCIRFAVRELVALKPDDIDFKAKTIRVDESSDQRGRGKLGPCKNVAAYRTVLLADAEGQEALKALKKLMDQFPSRLVFESRRRTPFVETHVLHDGLHPALKACNLPKAGMHAFRHGCNRRWELSGLNPAVLRQQMGHSTATMTARYTGQIPMEQVRKAFANGTKIVVLENMENEVAA